MRAWISSSQPLQEPASTSRIDSERPRRRRAVRSRLWASSASAASSGAGGGWYSQEESFRWIAPHASAQLLRPAVAREFEIIVNIPEEQIKHTGPIDVSVTADGAEIGKSRFTKAGIHTSHWPAPKTQSGQINVEILVTPEYRPSNGDTRRLGVAIVGFGFK